MSNQKKKFNIEVGTSIISIFARMETETIQLFSEFIDNSLQSYLDHKEQLNKIGINSCNIKITWTKDEVVIEDNAFGMNEEEFGNALRLNSPAKKYTSGSLSKYGIGLKYAAASFGKKYTIESTSYGSDELYYGVIDIEEFKKNNPKELLCEVKNVDKESHYTKIIITKLIRKYTNNEQEKVEKLLGKVYEQFLTDKSLRLSINSVPVEFTEPEYRLKPNGNEYLDFFNNSFEFEGKIYEYTGFIAILKKGNQDESGFQLKLHGRVLELSYKPKELLGRGNDYKQQRIYGVIEFLGDNWIPRFDKDGIAWGGTGIESRFIESLKSNKEVNQMLKTAIKLRKEDNPTCKVSSRVSNAHLSGIKRTYATGETVLFSVYPLPGYIVNTVKVNGEKIDSVPDHPNSYSFQADAPSINLVVTSVEDPNYITEKTEQTEEIKEQPVPVITAKELIPSEISYSEMNLKERIESRFSYLKNINFPVANESEKGIDKKGIIIKFKNTEYSFIVNEVMDTFDKDFIKIKEEQPYQNTFIIDLNFSVCSLQQIHLVTNVKEIFYINSIVLALSRILALNNGCSFTNSEIILNAFNSLMNKRD